MKGLTLTVSQLNEYVRRSLASDPMLRGICLTGEISNFKRHVSGHWYFTLKDEEAAINCAMFRQSAQTVLFRPENGQRVKLIGSVGLYSKTGSYQFYADSMEQDGIGDLYLRFEALKRKLAEEGLFDAALKKPLPLLPRGIGIVTSKTGAVVHDITRVSWRRFPGMPLYLCPVKVQGDGAAKEIAAGIRLLDKLPQADVIIVGRGGGSMEDLWPFNEECVARAIAECRTPIISAVGHETDFTIADFAADVRAATPSAAAEMAVPEKSELSDAIELTAQHLERVCRQSLAQKALQLEKLQKRLTSASPEKQRERMRASVSALCARMDGSLQRTIAAQRSALDTAFLLLDNQARVSMVQRRYSLERTQLRLNAASPAAAFQRGYAIVTDEKGVVRSVDMLYPGSVVTMHLADGTAAATVDAVNRKG